MIARGAGTNSTAMPERRVKGISILAKSGLGGIEATPCLLFGSLDILSQSAGLV